MGLPKSCLEVGIDESQFEGLRSTGVDDHQYGSSGTLAGCGRLLVGKSFLYSLVETSGFDTHRSELRGEGR